MTYDLTPDVRISVTAAGAKFVAWLYKRPFHAGFIFAHTTCDKASVRVARNHDGELIGLIFGETTLHMPRRAVRDFLNAFRMHHLLGGAA